MALTGKTLDLGKKEIYDKHSIGGVPGDKTSMMVVPIIGAAGLTIPKTSSRAITSPAGTADRFECLAPVNLDLEEIKKVVKKINCCLVWGGAVDLAPADDMFIKIEYPLSIDPLLLPSVMSKKKAVGAKYLVIDIPTGEGAKVKTTKDAEHLADQFIDLGKKLGIKTVGASTYGEQPIGHAIGPALEAREALSILMKGKGPQDAIDKVANIAGMLLDFKLGSGGKEEAMRLLHSGKAYRKLQAIIEAQGGDPKIKPEDLPVGKEVAEVKSGVSGVVGWINNHSIVEISRAAGTPKDRGAGMMLHKKIGDPVRKGETLFEIYADKNYKLQRALKIAGDSRVIGVGKKHDMLLEKIPMHLQHPKYFILER
jgi:AMP phosphorylase